MTPADLTPYGVVRDSYGHLRLVDDGYLTYMGEPMAASDEARSLPVTPILDRDGLPIVRTVGDLTHKHIGKGVRVFEGPHFILRGLLTFARGEETDYAELAADWDDGADDWDFIELPLDTPCEVES